MSLVPPSPGSSSPGLERKEDRNQQDQQHKEHFRRGAHDEQLPVESFNQFLQGLHLPDLAEIDMVGGVAANSRLREKLRSDAQRKAIRVHIPSLQLCGDNAAMIAAVGYHYLKTGTVSDLQDDVFSRNRL